MIESVSHITFVAKDLDKTTELFKELFGAKEVYYSGDQIHSLSKERFFIIGGQWIAVMENKDIVNRTYHHVAFKIKEEDIDMYLNKVKKLNLDMKPPRPRIKGEGYSIYFYDYDHNLFELHTGTLEERLSSYKAVDRKE
ncbi:catechol 2,3-dioxygenase-like lactoylglutathione lyase family enzyme [Bacillus mesophilus]|uniref:FosX/FosE/FosI family fosfomycin resistance thiol transferase n=1 Tax=Bacillus mesophilus TaxID=1808955 RepID=A0A6M0QAV1_9BACI|nr:FosX/FosE/FosI family fosfomycin resistance hydrolase [Bacillus mesophilus]MBM7662887.1 catechol 2,3-dioxygenase-like lactoylglutathione lyase family enzyme [Bacillus mesophilus]NEY73476.1 FosX/FosE/FosI family fosfomycin resistance thiol transferase [Bacillus mesophilus]